MKGRTSFTPPSKLFQIINKTICFTVLKLNA